MAVNILGTTSEQGLGANRKGRTAKYDGNIARLNTGGLMQGLNPKTGQVSIGAAAGLKAPTLQARNTLAFTQETPTAAKALVSDKAALAGMTTLARSLDNYTEELSEAEATAATIMFKESLFDEFHGNDEKGIAGFRHTKGLGTTGGYQNYSKNVDENMRGALEALDPISRQKAVMHMFAVRDDYLNKGAQHVVQEKENLRQFNNEATRQSIEKEAFAYPPDILSKEQVGPNGEKFTAISRLKQEWYSTFDMENLAQAEATFDKMVLGIGDKIYQDNRGKLGKDGYYKIGSGLEDARVFRETIGAATLSPESLAFLDKQIGAWEDTEASKYVSNNTRKEAQEAKNKVRAQSTNEAEFYNRIDDENPANNPTLQEVNNAFAIGKLSKQSHSVLRNAIKSSEAKTDAGEYSVELEQYFNDKLNDMLANHFSDGESNTLIKELEQSTLDTATKRQISSKLMALVAGDKSNTRAKANAEIKEFISPTYKTVQGGGAGPKQVKTDTEQKLERRALERYDELILDGVSNYDAVNKVKSDFSGQEPYFASLPSMPGYGKPETREEFIRVANMIEADYASGEEGAIGPEEYEELGNIAKNYKSFFEVYNPVGTAKPSPVQETGVEVIDEEVAGEEGADPSTRRKLVIDGETFDPVEILHQGAANYRGIGSVAKGALDLGIKVGRVVSSPVGSAVTGELDSLISKGAKDSATDLIESGATSIVNTSVDALRHTPEFMRAMGAWLKAMGKQARVTKYNTAEFMAYAFGGDAPTYYKQIQDSEAKQSPFKRKLAE